MDREEPPAESEPAVAEESTDAPEDSE